MTKRRFVRRTIHSVLNIARRAVGILFLWQAVEVTQRSALVLSIESPTSPKEASGAPDE